MPSMTTTGNHRDASRNFGHAPAVVSRSASRAARLTCIELSTTEHTAKTVMIGARMCARKDPHCG